MSTTTDQPPKTAAPDPAAADPTVDAASANEPRFFFLTGAQKSGTTWMEWMLNSHPEVLVKGESWFFGHPEDVNTWFNREPFEQWLKRPIGKFMSRYGADELSRVARRGMIEALMKLRTRPGVRVIGDRTPYFYCSNPDLIHDLFPDGKFINMVRDGRDVVVSHLFHLLRLDRADRIFSPEQAEARKAFHFHGEGEPTPLFTEESLRQLTQRWKTAVRGGFRAQELFGDQYLEIRYEAIREDPMILHRAFEFLEVDARPGLTRACFEKQRFEIRSEGRAPGEADPTSFVRKGIVGDWRNYFTDEDKAIFKDIAGPLLVRLGYETDSSW